MVSLFFKSLMFVITISYVCSVTIVNALHPTLPESSINMITNKVTESLITIDSGSLPTVGSPNPIDIEFQPRVYNSNTINTGYQPIVSSPNIIINSPNIINIGTQPVTGNRNNPLISDPGTEKRNQARIAHSNSTIQTSCYDECKKKYQSIEHLVNGCTLSCEEDVKSRLGLY
jgi:hypothetical protein